MNYSGLSFFDKIDFWYNKTKYNFTECSFLNNKNYEVKSNLVFIGKHEGNILVRSNQVFILRGELIGNIIGSENSRILIFGKIKGNVKSEKIELFKNSIIKGDIITKKLIIEQKVEFEGKVSNFK